MKGHGTHLEVRLGREQRGIVKKNKRGRKAEKRQRWKRRQVLVWLWYKLKSRDIIRYLEILQADRGVIRQAARQAGTRVKHKQLKSDLLTMDHTVLFSVVRGLQTRRLEHVRAWWTQPSGLQSFSVKSEDSPLPNLIEYNHYLYFWLNWQSSEFGSSKSCRWWHAQPDCP